LSPAHRPATLRAACRADQTRRACEAEAARLVPCRGVPPGDARRTRAGDHLTDDRVAHRGGHLRDHRDAALRHLGRLPSRTLAHPSPPHPAPPDHANIFLITAGTYTPLAVLMLRTDQAVLLLSVLWGAAALGAA